VEIKKKRAEGNSRHWGGNQSQTEKKKKKKKIDRERRVLGKDQMKTKSD